ncbi:MAG: hypothetical protein IPJ81_08805 [Chitinophagaceae bacterium]|nr:hypothetical protein [Chitinophagaceae bacterium]
MGNTTTVYLRDAGGNVMSTYTIDAQINNGHLTQNEVHLYGSSRLGINEVNRDVQALAKADYLNKVNTFVTGDVRYELTDHLGNVMVTVSDKKLQVDANADGVVDYYTADVVSATDYAPFGMSLNGRKFNASGYRFGFNGKENDKDISEGGQDYGLRVSDNRIGRFLSVDPLGKEFPYLSSYQFAANSPIENSDLDGGEPDPSTQKQAGKTATTLTVITQNTVKKGTELAVDATGKLIQQKAKQSIGTRALSWVASTAGKALGLTLYFVFSPANGHQSYHQEIRQPGYDWQGKPIPGYVPQIVPAPQSNPAPLPDPRKAPSTQENGEEGYYVYKTASTDKIRTGYVDKSAGSLPYYGITKGAIIGGRYSASNERATNLSVGNNGIIAQTNYYTAGGIESALIILNTYGSSMLNTKSLKALVRSSPGLSTRIDNKTVTFTNPTQIISGVMWLNKNIPGWQTSLKEKENKKGPTHPDK